MALTTPVRRAALRQLGQVLGALDGLPTLPVALRADLDQARALLCGVQQRLQAGLPGGDVLAALAASIGADGGELLGTAELTPQRGAPKPRRWLTPAEANINYSQVWTVRTASKDERQV